MIDNEDFFNQKKLPKKKNNELSYIMMDMKKVMLLRNQNI